MAESRPCIGIVTTRLPSEQRVNGRAVIRPTGHFCRIAQAAHALGATVILFRPSDVNWRLGRVVAWTHRDPTKPFDGWVRRQGPLPNVIYENVYVHLAVAGYSSELRKEALMRHIPLFNPIMPGKWQMTKVLRDSEHRQYLPPTERLDDVAKAVVRVREWGEAYIKPSGGYGGNGVTRVESLSNRRYRISIDRLHGKVKGIRDVVDEHALTRRLRALKHTPHLVQRGLPLMTVGGRKIDFRVVVHRDGKGQWQLIGMVPKQAAQDGVVTNLIAGGERLSLAQCVRLAKAEGKAIPEDDLRECATRVASLLSRRNDDVGLAGFDLGVDKSRKVWVIEMNPKPARSLMTDEMRQTLARCQAEFAMYLVKRKR